MILFYYNCSLCLCECCSALIKRSIACLCVVRMMYWTDRGKVPKIEKASMDGTARKKVILFSYSSSPIGLAIDHGG